MEKYKSCVHAESVGQYAVFVKPSCRHVKLVKGVCVVSKDTCRCCLWWRPKKGESNEQKNSSPGTA